MKQVIVPDLIHIPVPLYSFVRKTIQENPRLKLYRFPYSELAARVPDDGSPEFAMLRRNLEKYEGAGNYYVFIADHDMDQYDMFLTGVMAQEKKKDLFDQMKDIFGISSYHFVCPRDRTSDNCISILNAGLLNTADWDGTLQHQMTHFVHRMIGVDDVVSRDWHDPSEQQKGFGSRLSRYSMELAMRISPGSPDGLARMFQKKYRSLFKKQQIQQMLQSCIGMFYNIYLSRGEGMDRMEWLDGFLDKINSTQFLESEQCRDLVELWKKDSVLCDPEQLQAHRYISYIICYYGFKHIVDGICIDQKLRYYFFNHD